MARKVVSSLVIGISFVVVKPNLLTGFIREEFSPVRQGVGMIAGYALEGKSHSIASVYYCDLP